MSKFTPKDLIFVTTFISKANIDNLIDSVCESNTGLKILLVVVCQNGFTLDKNTQNGVEIKQLNTLLKLSLSAARNVAIKYIIEQQIRSDFIMFPDDDSTFNRSFFLNYKSLTKGENYIVDIYVTGTNSLFRKLNIRSNSLIKSNKWFVACSVNMLISFDSFIKVGYFDETLGVGTQYGAGEDNDYYIRICQISKGFYYNNLLYNFHPAFKEVVSNYTFSQLMRRYDGYGKGVVACLCKHKMYNAAFRVCLRALGGCIKNILCFKIDYGIAYLNSFYSRLNTLTIVR